jgi:hypothetical protein
MRFPTFDMKRSEPVIYPFPPGTVFSAIREVIPQTKLRLLAADPHRWVVVAERRMSLLTLGQTVTVYVWESAPGQTAVQVESHPKDPFGWYELVTAAHGRNIRAVFNALDRRLQGEAPATEPESQTKS